MNQTGRFRLAIYLFFSNALLFRLNSGYRACACAGTAVNAKIRLDFEFAVAFADSCYRAGSLAGSTADASVRNFKCHK